MAGKNKLELTWIGKDKRPRLEPRILLEDPAYSHHAPTRKEGDQFDNVLIKGDNLLALKALEQDYAGKVKCVFIDPPYNTGSAFTLYDDGIEHSVWLGLMRDRLEVLRSLLSEDGSFWITLDDNEIHYFKVMCDEVFGRANFITNAIWQKKYAPANDALWFSENHDHILVYAKDKSIWRPNKIDRTEEQDKLYKNIDNDHRGAWMSDNYTCAKTSDERPNLYYSVINPNTGQEIWPSKTRVWAFEKETHSKHVSENRIYWGKDGTNSTPRLKKFLSELRNKGTVPQTIWPFDQVGHTQDAKREAKLLNAEDPFPTPKPEKLIERIVAIATKSGDLVLDSFAGSGTTGAVAHKMGRRWIMVELGDHCETHVVPRLKKVIDGEDQGGISKAVEWKGGGGYRYFKLAPSLLEKDDFGQWVFSKAYNPQMLTEALCKHFNFVYAPSAEVYWQHGHNSATDFIFCSTTSQSLEQLKSLSEAVGPDRSLLICCTAFETANVDAFPNLTLRKIPNAILNSCEWGHDDYSLKIANLPIAEEEDWALDDEPEPAPVKSRKKVKAEADSGDLFGDEQ